MNSDVEALVGAQALAAGQAVNPSPDTSALQSDQAVSRSWRRSVLLFVALLALFWGFKWLVERSPPSGDESAVLRWLRAALDHPTRSSLALASAALVPLSPGLARATR